MSRAAKFPWLPPVLPALILALLSTTLWFALPNTPTALVGWLCLTTLLATIAAIATALTAPPDNSPRPLVGLAAVLLVHIAITSSVVFPNAGFLSAAATAALAAAWTALWGLLARALRRRGPGIALMLPLTLASLAMALPVAAMPLVRWAGHWGTTGAISPWQGRVVAAIAHACPFFPLLSALQPAIRLDWGALPLMYASSGLGQEIPLQLPSPWLSCALYATLALALLLLDRVILRPRRS